MENVIPQYKGDGRPIAFLAGKITGVANYKEKFDSAEKELTKYGYIVLNPAWLPVGMDYEHYAPIDDAMLRQADIVFLLDGWDNSSGTAHEIKLTKKLEIPICRYLEDRNDY